MSDYVGAQKIQQELARRLPGDKTINEFSKLLPDEVLAQKQAEAGEAEYDEEYDDEYDAEDGVLRCSSFRPACTTGEEPAWQKHFLISF